MKSSPLLWFGSFALIAILVGAVLFTVAPRPVAAQDAADSPVRSHGRFIGDRIASKDTDGIFALFTPQMAQQVPRAAVQQLIDQVVTAQTSLGARESETTSEQNGLPVYIALYRWKPEASLQMTITFADPDTDRIAGLLLQPVAATKSAAANPDSASSDSGALAAGRSVMALVAKADAGGLYNRFTPYMAKSFPESKVRQLLSQLITSQSPLGKRIDESVTADPAARTVTYTAVYRWKGTRDLALTVVFVQGSGGRIASLRLQEKPFGALPADPRLGYRLRARLHLPFAPGDTWTVAWGGDTRDRNYHVDYPDQRHAFDLYILRDGSSHRGDGKVVEDYYAWGRRIVAPAAGTVIEAVDALPDNLPGKRDAAHALGNHVLLDLGNREYAVFAHLRRGSVTVKSGDRVEAGLALGLCGNSGNTTEPHLHFHVQDKPYAFRDAIGLPVVFVDYVSNGRPVAAGSPIRGEQISTGGATTARAYP